MPDHVASAAADARGEALLQRIFADTMDMVVVVDRELRLVACNPAFSREFNSHYGLEPGLGLELAALLAGAPDDRAAGIALFERALQGERFTTTAVFGPRRQHYLLSFGCLRAASDAVEYVFAICHNVEERERQHALERDRLRTVLDVLPVGVWITDEQGRFAARNRAGTRIWGEDAPMSERPEAYGADYRGWWPDGREIQSDEWGLARALARGEISEAEELEILIQDGQRKTVINYALPIRNAAGEISSSRTTAASLWGCVSMRRARTCG